MIVEVIAVGTELLLGEIVNSNAATIGRRLAEDGYDVHHHVTVGDNLTRLATAIRQAVTRADAVILTGGIGPTPDDLTRDALCVVGDRTITRDETHAAFIRDRITRTHGSVSGSTLRMADHPTGTEPLPNRNGVALGIAMEHDGTAIFALPGVPSEMAVMLDEQVLPRLRRAAGEPAVLRSRVLRTWGLGESSVADALDDLFATANPSIAFLVDGVEVRVRISAKAPDARTASSMIAEVEREVAGRLGDAVFGRDGQTVEAVLARQLAARGWTVGAVEGVTHGLVATTLATAGTDVFGGGLVVPDSAAGKADALADRGLDVLGTDVVVAVGAAEPDADDDQSRRVAMAVHTPEHRRRRTLHLLGDAPRIREHGKGTALHLARLAVTGAWWPDDADG